MLKNVCFTALSIFIVPGSGFASDNPFLGKWSIQSSVSAPWMSEDATPYDASQDSYINKNVEFNLEAMTGPGFFSCDAPAYIVEPLPPDVIFQGGLAFNPSSPTAEPDDKRAQKAAIELGLDHINVLTLENRCSELALHMVDAQTILFAADNRIYTLHRLPE